VLSIRISEVTRNIKKLKNKDIFTHYEGFDAMISQIVQMFESSDFCRKYRLYQNFIYMIFLDLVKIYNVFYIMTMETLDRYKKMNPSEMNKALVLYKNFCNFTNTLKKEANTIPMLFGFTFKEPNYYKPDAKKERAMKNAMKDNERGGFDEDQDGSFGDEMPDLDGQDANQQDNYYDEAKEDEDEGDSDGDYNFDILGDARKIEQMASVHGSKRSATMVGKSQKIKVDDFNTAALDDLLAGEVKPPMRSETTKQTSHAGNDDEWDPFANNDGNVYSTEQPSSVPVSSAKPAAKSGNIFGDDDDDGMWGGNNGGSAAQNDQSNQRQTLEDILGGDAEDVGARSQSMVAPKQDDDFNMLKNLYNTSAIPPPSGNNMMTGGGGQQDYYNTGMGNGAGYGGASNSMYNAPSNYNQQQPQAQNYGGGNGYDNQNQFNTGYNNNMGGGYGTNQGYDNNNNQGYNTMGGGGYNNSNMGGGYPNNAGAQNTGYNTSAPGGQQNQNNAEYDPFS
jgi:hypothetical protein